MHFGLINLLVKCFDPEGLHQGRAFLDAQKSKDVRII